MIVEVKGVQFVNKGAALMLYAILERVRSTFPDVKFTIVPNPSSCPYEKLTALGVYPKIWLQRYKIQWGYLANKLPRKLLRRYGLVVDAQVDVVLDASGFAYGDQWGSGSTVSMAKAMRRWRKQGTRVILLPQAFGPFTGKQIRRAFRTVAELADRIYARDPLSYRYVVDVAGNITNLKQAPDFTVLINGKAPSSFDSSRHEVAIIPNSKMVEKTTTEVTKRYIPFLAICIRSFLAAGLKPFFLIHAGPKDEAVAYEVIKTVDEEIPIIVKDNPLEVKGIIGASKAVVCSRYHGLVSAFSQRIPAIATSWSHKYQTLLEEYNCTEFLLSPDLNDDEIRQAIDKFIRNMEHLKKQLEAPAEKHKRAAEEMWKDVLDIMAEGRKTRT